MSRKDGKDDGWEHTDCTENRGQSHISDYDAAEQCDNNGL